MKSKIFRVQLPDHAINRVGYLQKLLHNLYTYNTSMRALSKYQIAHVHQNILYLANCILYNCIVAINMVLCYTNLLYNKENIVL